MLQEESRIQNWKVMACHVQANTKNDVDLHFVVAERYFASLKEWHEVFLMVNGGQLCLAYRKRTFDHFGATGGIQRLIRPLQRGIKQRLKERNVK